MSRVKRGKIAHKRRKGILQQVKGFRWGRRSKLRLAKDALRHARVNAYRDRKKKKRNFRRLWQIQIGAALDPSSFSYSRFIHTLKEYKIELNRKILSQLGKEHPEIFQDVVKEIKD
jgi:large subunit ribosomal protein L20